MVNASRQRAVIQTEQLADLFKLLSDQTRLRILVMLAGGERNVGSICQELGLPQPTVSHHLGLLRMQNLIKNRRNGKQVFYGLDDNVSAGDSLLQLRLEGHVISIAGSALAAAPGDSPNHDGAGHLSAVGAS